MEFTKSILIIISISSLLSLCTEAHRHPSVGGSFEDSSISAELSKFISIPTLPVTSIPPSLLQACSGTKNPIRCASFIASFQPNGATDADPLLVLNANIKALRKLVLHVKSLATKISRDPSTPFLFRTSLNKCVHFYDNAIVNLARASTACSAHNTALAKALLSGAVSHFGSCDQTFTKNGLKSFSTNSFEDDKASKSSSTDSFKDDLASFVNLVDQLAAWLAIGVTNPFH